MDDLLTHAQTILGTTSSRWADLTGRVSPEVLSRPPSPGQWSALECLQHLVDTEPVFRFRVRGAYGRTRFPRL